MLTEAQLLQLKDAVAREAGASQMILGARLGEVIRDEFPEFNIKAEYRSLRKFIETQLSAWLVIAGKHGQDVQYTLDLSRRATAEPDLRTPSGNENSIAVPVAKSNRDELATSGKPDPDQVLRQAIKTAIDAMTMEQLRQLVLPAGIMFDATNKAANC